MDIDGDYSHLRVNRLTNHKKKKINTDSIHARRKEKTEILLDQLRHAAEHNYHNNINALLLGGERTDFFVTEDSRRYISTEQERQRALRCHYIDAQKRFDSVHARYHKERTVSERQYEYAKKRIQNTYAVFASYRTSLQLDLSPYRMWQVSLTGAMIFGMVSMSLIYSNLGQSALAKDGDGTQFGEGDGKKVVRVIENTKEDDSASLKSAEDDEKEEVKEKEIEEVQLSVNNASAKEEKDAEKESPSPETLANQEKKDVKEKDDVKKSVVVADIVQPSSADVSEEQGAKTSSSEDSVDQKKKTASIDSAIKKDVEEMEESDKTLEELAKEVVEGYPIEKMLPYILEQDPEVAKYLIAIAKQESGWGKRVPVLNGQDCYNYWGYRGIRKLMGSGGHTCFNSRKDAVETVGKRIHELIYEYDRKTAERLIVWKCGRSCAGHSQAGVDRWIGTVDMYYDRLSQK